MVNNQQDKIFVALEEFVVRASQKEATPEEIEALPKVAKILMEWRTLVAT